MQTERECKGPIQKGGACMVLDSSGLSYLPLSLLINTDPPIVLNMLCIFTHMQSLHAGFACLTDFDLTTTSGLSTINLAGFLIVVHVSVGVFCRSGKTRSRDVLVISAAISYYQRKLL